MAGITWAQLVALMAVGDGPDPALRGVVRSREVVPADDDEPADVEIPGHGRYRWREGRVRVYRRGTLVRREGLDGRPTAIEGADTVWVWENGADLATAFPRASNAWGWADAALVRRRAFDQWRGDDFTHAAAAPVATTLLGRDAWQVELLPPGHKPFPVSLVVDAATGLVLSQRNEGFGSSVEWEELELDVELPDELFVWDGPTKPPRDHHAEHEAELARRRDWLARNGVPPLVVSLPVELMLHDESDDGTFQASLRTGFHGSIARRRHSDEPWDLFMNWPHVERWSSGGWDWWLGADEEIDPAVLESLKEQLSDES